MKMFSYFLIISAMLANLKTVYAADDTKNLNESSDVVVMKKPKVVYEDSSEFHRMNKKFQATAQLAGFTVAPIDALGINLAAFINRDALVQLEYSQGKVGFLWTQYKATVLGLHYKRFFGNSFYVNGGVDYRNISMKTDDVFFADDNGKEIGESESLVASVAIGNQWQWENFTLGCDWIGLGVPFAKLDSKYDDTGFTAEERDRARNDWDDLGEATHAQFLRFYLGATF